MTNINSYITKLEQIVYEKISEEINEKTIDRIINENLYNSHIKNIKSANFQNYYFETLNNENMFFNSSNFFRQFKMQYALQGIDNNYLDNLGKNKREIITLIRKDSLAQLYFETFYKTRIKHKDSFKEKNLGSFFAKLVHTFQPDKYCALDNPIKEYFGLLKESFFISFLIISKEYANWGKNNQKIIETIKTKLRIVDKKEIIKQEKLTDLKLLDLIFWSKANEKK